MENILLYPRDPRWWHLFDMYTCLRRYFFIYGIYELETLMHYFFLFIVDIECHGTYEIYIHTF